MVIMKISTVDLSEVFVVNDPNITAVDTFDYLPDFEKAKTGKTISEGGVLPDDNVRVYVPLDISEESILHELRTLYHTLGDPDDDNEFSFTNGMRKIYRKLDIYDEAMMERYPEQIVHCKDESGEVDHSVQVIRIVEKMIQIMEENEGCAEMFPYDAIDTLRDEYSINE